MNNVSDMILVLGMYLGLTDEASAFAGLMLRRGTQTTA